MSALLLSIAGLAVVSACGSSTHAESEGPPAPNGNLYQPPKPLPHRPPGTLIWAEKVPLPLNPPATVWQILYHSRSLAGKDIAVSGFAIVPTSAAASGRRLVYAWAHGSAGQADRCAPSHDVTSNLPPYGGLLVARGAELVATDYEGLGTPGEPTPYVGIAEGHAVLDSVRAAGQLPVPDPSAPSCSPVNRWEGALRCGPHSSPAPTRRASTFVALLPSRPPPSSPQS